jgi:hypothetical protein
LWPVSAFQCTAGPNPKQTFIWSGLAR